VVVDGAARKSADPGRGKRHLFESDFNQLLSLTGTGGTTQFQYDANGNQTQKIEPTGTTTNTWDARDRLTQVNAAGGIMDRFGYDTNNLRVFVQDSQGSRRILLDGVEELREYEADTATAMGRSKAAPSFFTSAGARLTVTFAGSGLGASGWQMFFRVSLPKVKWGVLYGVIPCNARAMGEFGAVSVVSGHIRGQTDTMPLHVEILYNEYNFAGAFAVASLLTLLA
jgi:YD repeat-containing protein